MDSSELYLFGLEGVRTVKCCELLEVREEIRNATDLLLLDHKEIKFRPLDGVKYKISTSLREARGKDLLTSTDCNTAASSETNCHVGNSTVPASSVGCDWKLFVKPLVSLERIHVSESSINIQEITASSPSKDVTLTGADHQVLSHQPIQPAPPPYATSSSPEIDLPHICDICDKIFTSVTGLSEHLPSHPLHVCSECNERFFTAEQLSHHVLSHAKKKHPCPSCGKRFARPYGLAEHEKTHIGVRPFACPECGKTFTLHRQLTRHAKSHSVIMCYECKHCGKAYSKYDSMRKHVIRTHEAISLSSAGKPYFSKTVTNILTTVTDFEDAFQ